MYERGYKSFSVFSLFNICIYVYIIVSAYFAVCLNGFDHGYKCGIHNVLKSIPIQFYFSIGVNKYIILPHLHEVHDLYSAFIITCILHYELV